LIRALQLVEIGIKNCFDDGRGVTLGSGDSVIRLRHHDAGRPGRGANTKRPLASSRPIDAGRIEAEGSSRRQSFAVVAQTAVSVTAATLPPNWLGRVPSWVSRSSLRPIEK